MSRTPSVTGSALAAALDGGDAPLVVDVRSRVEYALGRVPGAVHVPFWLAFWRARSLAAHEARGIVVYCGHGPRADLAIAQLRARGITRVSALEGHWSGWRRAGRPREPPAG